MNDETKCSWPIQPIQIILRRIKGPIFSIADINSAYNQMPLEKPSQRLTNFVISGQQYCFKRLFYGISICPAAFSSLKSSLLYHLSAKIKSSPILTMFSFKTQQQTQCYKHSISITKFLKMKTSKPLQSNLSFS